MKSPLIERNGGFSVAKKEEPIAIGSLAVGTDTIDDSASMQVGGKKGFLGPALTTEERDDIDLPAIGLMIFNSDLQYHEEYTANGWQPIGRAPIDGGTF